MLNVRVIPILLMQDSALVKGVKFTNHRYVGDPINAVRIFNEKEVDELIILDIGVSKAHGEPNFELLQSVASEAFMPMGYGGGISKVSQIEKLFNLGFEKVIINSSAFFQPNIIEEASKIAGSQSIVVSIDVRKKFWGGHEVYVGNGIIRTKLDPVDYARRMQDLGAGELIVCSIDKDGLGTGYDLDLIKIISDAVEIPVVAMGGAGSVQDFFQAVQFAHASAVAAGSMFVFHGKHKAVLITYPCYGELETLLSD